MSRISRGYTSVTPSIAQIGKRLFANNNNNQYMRAIIYICVSVVMLLISCTRTVYVPVVNTKTITTTRVDTFFEITTPGERVVNITTDTTSTISTLYATSTATVSNGTLRHEITQHERKDSVRTQIVYINQVDSISYAVPVIEEVTPSWCWPTIIATIVICVSIVLVIKSKK